MHVAKEETEQKLTERLEQEGETALEEQVKNNDTRVARPVLPVGRHSAAILAESMRPKPIVNSGQGLLLNASSGSRYLGKDGVLQAQALATMGMGVSQHNLSAWSGGSPIGSFQQTQGQISGRQLSYASCQQQVAVWSLMRREWGVIKRGELLGRGSFADVYSGLMGSVRCAIKVYKSTQSAQKDGQDEIKLMSSLDHPCVLRLIGWARQPLAMLVELALGDMVKFYNNEIKNLAYSEWQALVLLKVGPLVGCLRQFFSWPIASQSCFSNHIRNRRAVCDTFTLSGSSIVTSNQATSWLVNRATGPRSQTMGLLAWLIQTRQ